MVFDQLFSCTCRALDLDTFAVANTDRHSSLSVSSDREVRVEELESTRLVRQRQLVEVIDARLCDQAGLSD